MTQKIFAGKTVKMTIDLPEELFQLYRDSAHTAKLSRPQYARLAIWAIICNDVPDDLPPIPGMIDVSGGE